MARYFFFLLAVLGVSASVSMAQLAPPRINWTKCYGGSGTDIADAIRRTADGGYIVAGISGSTDGEVLLHHGDFDSYDYWIIKLNDTGATTWQQSLGGSNDDQATCVVQTSDGGYIVGGYSFSDDGNVQGHRGTTDSADAWIVRLDSKGHILWTNSYGGNGQDEAYNIIQTLDGGFIVAGLSNSVDLDVSGNHGGADMWIFKIDASGNLLWSKSFGGSADDGAYSMIQLPDGNFLATGFAASSDHDVTSNAGSDDLWAVKFDSLGTLLWQHSYGGSGEDNAFCAAASPEGAIYLAGYSTSSDGIPASNRGDEDVWILKIDPLGSVVWSKTFGGSAGEAAFSITQTADRNLVVAGFTESTDDDITSSHGGDDYWVIKFDSAGTVLWQQTYGGSGDELAGGIDATPDSGVVISGSTNSSDGDVTGHLFAEDYWVIKLPRQGIFDQVAQTSRSITSCFPNPFSDHTTIIFPEPISSEATLSIKNILGETVRTMNVSPGVSQLTINRDALPAGVYGYDLRSEGNVIVSGSFIVN